MRIGVIRGDLPGPIYLGDLETISQYDPAIEPEGQTYYIGRPTTAEIEAALADASTGGGAVLEGADISGTYPITINAGNQTLKLRSAAAPVAFETFLIPTGAYADEASLLAAINTVLTNTGYTARSAVTSGAIAIESDTYGVNSYIENDTVALGSTANTPLGLTDGSIRTMVPAATLIADCLPVGGPLDVSSATIDASGAGTAAGAIGLLPAARGTNNAVANAIAPYIGESPTAILSFQVGVIAGARSALFSPDSRRLPPLPAGAAISVVQDDGVTPFVAPLCTLATAVIGGGNLTLTGTGMGSYEIKETVVKVTGTINLTLDQVTIENAGGTVNPTSIVIPLTLLPGLVITTCSAQVRNGTLASSAVVVT
jgi:hypothetical protein